MMAEQKTISRMKPWSRTIMGQPYSKANSRQQVFRKGKLISIKSKNALRYVEDFHKQCPYLDPMFEEDVSIEIDIYYASRRPDLDESLILDCLQGKVIKNDRQIRRKFVRGFVDRDRPRAEIRIEPLDH